MFQKERLLSFQRQWLYKTHFIQRLKRYTSSTTADPWTHENTGALLDVNVVQEWKLGHPIFAIFVVGQKGISEDKKV